jgi:hypothetical protein
MNDCSTRTTKLSTVMQQQVNRALVALGVCYLTCDVQFQVYVLCYCLSTPAGASSATAAAPAPAPAVATVAPQLAQSLSSTAASLAASSSSKSAAASAVTAVLTSDEDDEEDAHQQSTCTKDTGNTVVQARIADADDADAAAAAATVAAAHARAASLSIRPPPGFNAGTPQRSHSGGIVLPVRCARVRCKCRSLMTHHVLSLAYFVTTARADSTSASRAEQRSCAAVVQVCGVVFGALFHDWHCSRLIFFVVVIIDIIIISSSSSSIVNPAQVRTERAR